MYSGSPSSGEPFTWAWTMPATSTSRQPFRQLHECERGQPDARRGIARVLVGKDPRLDHFAQQVRRDDARLVHPQFGTEEGQARRIEVQGRGTPADFAGYEQFAFREPAFVDQVAHEQADGGFRESQDVGQRRARQPGLRADLAHDGHAVQLFEELLVTGDWHGTKIRVIVMIMQQIGKICRSCILNIYESLTAGPDEAYRPRHRHHMQRSN